MVALQTGMRKGEILNLEWDNINFEYGFIDLLKTKTNRPRKIPLSTGLKAILRTIKQESKYVFTNPKTKTAYKISQKLLKLFCKMLKLRTLDFMN